VIFPALLDAGKDPLFVERRTLTTLYVHLIGRLDFAEFRRVRASRVATDLCVRPETVGAGLRALVRAGYLVRGERVMDVFTYRLVYSRATEPAS
jgi:hypothetical protein